VRALAVLLLAAAACTSFSAPDSPSDGGAVDGAAPLDASTIDASDGPLAEGVLRVFATSVGYADITSAANADTKCAAEALGRLPGTFVAWYPDPLMNRSAASRLVTTRGIAVDGPWYRVDGKRVAANRGALSNTSAVPLENPIDVNASGVQGGGGVWTGTFADGGIGVTCSAPNPTTGNASSVNASWTTQTAFSATCGTSLRLYCFQVE